MMAFHCKMFLSELYLRYIIKKQSFFNSYTDVSFLYIQYWEVKILLIPQIGDMFLKEKLNTLRLDFVFMNNSELCTKSSEFLNDMVQNFF